MKKLIYTIAIVRQSENDYRGTAPDLPGFQSRAPTLKAALIQSREAIQSHIENLSSKGIDIPDGQPLEIHRENPEFAEAIWGVVEVAAAQSSRPIRLNISLPESLLEEIDAFAKANHLTRSGFLAKAALQAIKAVK